MGAPFKSKGRKYHKDRSDQNMRAMDLTNLPRWEQFEFDPYSAAKVTEAEFFKMQGQLETMAFTHPGRFRYALLRMLEIPRYSYRTYGTSQLWYSYVRRVFEAAAEAGNPEAGAIVMLTDLSAFAERAAKRRKRSERIMARPAEFRKEAAKKGAVTRERNRTERKVAKKAVTCADAAITSAFAALDGILTNEREDE